MESTNSINAYAKVIAPFFAAAMSEGMNAEQATIEAIRRHGAMLDKMATALVGHYQGRPTRKSEALIALATDGLYEALRAA